VEFLRHFSANMAINRGLLLLNALYAEASASASIGDRFVLEVHYTQQYQELPLTVDAAEKDGWTVSEECITGLGRRAHSTRFPNLWHDRNGALHLWFDHLGSVMGFGVSAESGVSDPWRRVGDHYEIDFLTRDPEAACGNGPKAKLGSVGDRLLLVNKHDVQALPVTLQGAFDEKFHDGGPCFPEMGWHMMLNRFDVSSPTPVYSGADGGLLAMNLNSYATSKLLPLSTLHRRKARRYMVGTFTSETMWVPAKGLQLPMHYPSLKLQLPRSAQISLALLSSATSGCRR